MKDVRREGEGKGDQMHPVLRCWQKLRPKTERELFPLDARKRLLTASCLKATHSLRRGFFDRGVFMCSHLAGRQASGFSRWLTADTCC